MRSSRTATLIKKEYQIFLIDKEVQNGAGSKSYMRKGILIYIETRKYLLVYEKAVSHIWLCNCSILNFPYIWGKFDFLFYQCRASDCQCQSRNSPVLDLRGGRRSSVELYLEKINSKKVSKIMIWEWQVPWEYWAPSPHQSRQKSKKKNRNLSKNFLTNCKNHLSWYFTVPPALLALCLWPNPRIWRNSRINYECTCIWRGTP